MPEQSLGLASRVKLNNGLYMPMIHLGLYLMSGREASEAVKYALDAGYRGFDSAQMYHNERQVGNAILEWLEKHPENRREDIFYTSKLESNSDFKTARASISKSVRECGLGYIDLFLLHSPYGGTSARLESWRAVEEAVLSGEIRTAGVSNFGEKHINELLSAKPRIKPAVNQIEVHPFNTRTKLVNYCRKSEIVVQAYAPLARSLRMHNPTIVELAKKYDCTPGQLLVRWSCQHGLVPLPKSVQKERIIANAQIGGFEISREDMARMDSLDECLVTGMFPTDSDRSMI